ncbi:MAG: threonine ammonia-lyase [Gemmatimonadaceae bacterium]
MFADVTADGVRRAAARLNGVARRTELRLVPRLSERAGIEVWIKLENEQITGSFKLRGAYNAIASLSPADQSRGVVAASAGNHGRGVAFAAQRFGVPATIFVPRTAPRVKVEGIRACGAHVDAESAHYDEAHARAKAFAAERHAVYLDPCVGEPLVAGQGTVALEILEQLPDVQTVIVPVGGAGLLGGMGAFLRESAPHVRIVGAQSTKTNAMALSLEAGRIVDIPVLETLADGLAGAIDEDAFDVGRHALDAMVAVEEAEIARAIAELHRHENVVAEGAGAVPIAVLLSGRIGDLSGPLVAVISGGNIDPDVLERVVAGGD